MALRYALLYAQTFYSIFGRDWRRPGANWTALQWADSYLDGGFVQNDDLVQEVNAAIAAGRIPVFKWTEIAKLLPGRTEERVRNYWYASIRKKNVHSTRSAW